MDIKDNETYEIAKNTLRKYVCFKLDGTYSLLVSKGKCE
jgi:hypothetical protein